MYFREVVWENVDCSHLAQSRKKWWAVVNTVMKFRVP